MRAALIAIAMFTCGCASSHGLDAPSETTRFALSLYASRLPFTYDYADLMAHFDAAAQTPSFELSEEDIVEYRAGNTQGSPAPRTGSIELVLTDEAAARLHAIPEESFFETQTFQITLDGARVYLGQIYTPIGAAAIATPILHGRDGATRPRDNIVVISNGLIPGSPINVDAPSLRAFFSELGLAAR